MIVHVEVTQEHIDKGKTVEPFEFDLYVPAKGLRLFRSFNSEDSSNR